MKARNLSFIFLIMLLTSSCQTNEVKLLTEKVQKLEKQIENLEGASSVLRQQNVDLMGNLRQCQGDEQRTLKLKEELEVCRMEYREYRYGNGTCLTRNLSPYEEITVCGAENIIDFLNSHYRY